MQEKRDAPLDVQVGEQLWTEAPQELRSRMWMALLQLQCPPFLLDSHKVGCKLCQLPAWQHADTAKLPAPPHVAV